MAKKRCHNSLYGFLKNEDGILDCVVDLDSIVAANPAPRDDGKFIVHTQNMSFLVDGEQLDKALTEKENANKEVQTLVSAINRLIQAMDRMTVHFPTSIRMHM